MQISNLTIHNFRAKDFLKLKFGKRLTILVGENGAGKTTILDALSIGLGAVLTHLPKVSGISFKNTDLKQTGHHTMPFSRIRIETTDNLVWDRTFRRDKSKTTTELVPTGVGLTGLKKYLDEAVIDPFNDGSAFQLPVFSYYGVSRALLDVPLRRRGFPKSHQRFEAFENALNAASRFKFAFVWYYNKENEEKRKQLELKDFNYRLPELQTVRKAISAMFPDITEPQIMLHPLRFVVTINGETLDIMQLSDGYKTLFSLIIDLASRMALANPDMDYPLDAPAIVLIDEVDLHLHPGWQQKVIGDLLNAFPGVQFIISTHSPYIIEAVNNHLMRFHINSLPVNNRDLEAIMPLSPNDVEAWYFNDNEVISLMDSEIKLLNNNLVHPFNKLAAVYNQLKDIQWDFSDND